MIKGMRYVLLDGTPGDTGAGAPAAPAGDAAAVTPAPAAPAATDGQGEAPAPSAGTVATGSALAAGRASADAAGGADAGSAAPGGIDAIPEKFRVTGADGALDPVASAAKVAEAYRALEQRLGTGDVRPKTAAEYKMPELPEALKDVQLDEEKHNAFRERAHKVGLSQSQFEFVMGEYLDIAPQLVAGGQAVSADQTIAELKTAWGKDYQTQAANAWRGLSQIASVAGMTVEQVDAELGNSPAFNRIMAAVGAQLREDTSINTGGNASGANGMADAAALQQSEAFRNPRHPEHAATVQKWNQIVTKGVADTPIM